MQHFIKYAIFEILFRRFLVQKIFASDFLIKKFCIQIFLVRKILATDLFSTKENFYRHFFSTEKSDNRICLVKKILATETFSTNKNFIYQVLEPKIHVSDRFSTKNSLTNFFKYRIFLFRTQNFIIF